MSEEGRDEQPAEVALKVEAGSVDQETHQRAMQGFGVLSDAIDRAWAQIGTGPCPKDVKVKWMALYLDRLLSPPSTDPPAMRAEEWSEEQWEEYRRGNRREEREARRAHAEPITVRLDKHRLLDLALVPLEDVEAIEDAFEDVKQQFDFLKADLRKLRRWLRAVVAAGEEAGEPVAGEEQGGSLNS